MRANSLYKIQMTSQSLKWTDHLIMINNQEAQPSPKKYGQTFTIKKLTQVLKIRI